MIYDGPYKEKRSRLLLVIRKNAGLKISLTSLFIPQIYSHPLYTDYRYASLLLLLLLLLNVIQPVRKILN